MSHSLSGHESFHCRHYWLKKGFDFIIDKRNFRDEDAVVHLGVGKNMVSSIRYWLRSFALTDENDNTTPIAEKLLSDNGWDPYLEDINTIYFLHFLLISTEKEFSAYLLFEILRKAKPEFDVNLFQKYAEAELGEQSDKVANTAFQVLIRSYISKDKGPIDEIHSGFLQELNLIEKAPRLANGFIIREDARIDLSPLVLLACMRLKNPNSNNFEFEQLMFNKNAVGKVFALTRDGLYQKLEELVDSQIVKCSLTDSAGIREFHLAEELNYIELLNMYYGN